MAFAAEVKSSRMIPEAEIERVKRQTDLLALARSRGIELKAHGGKDWIGRCPFHEDKTKPNFIVTPGKGLWHCMACGLAGNAIQFVQRHDRISFRHAFELLDQGGAAAFESRPQLQSRSSVPRLACPLDVSADDGAFMGQVAGYYHERFKRMGQAREYLAGRGLGEAGLAEHFQIGFADRTLGLRLPESNRQEGERLRQRLTQLGVWRQTGREHFTGCVVAPLRDAGGRVVSFYGRRVQRASEIRHLYSPGPHRGLFNPEGLAAGDELILCEAVLDALSFYAAGLKNVTCLFGTEGFTDELWDGILRHKIRRVRLAYDADEAGERAAKRDAKRLQAQGIEVLRIKFPWGMDANEYACKVTPAAKSLGLLVNAAQWMGGGKPAVTKDPVASDPPPSSDADAPAPSLAAAVVSRSAQENGLPEAPSFAQAAKEKMPVVSSSGNPPPVAPASLTAMPRLELRGEAWFMELHDSLCEAGANREYRVTGLEKANGAAGLKITLRLRAGDLRAASGTGRFHLDQLDLCRDADRRRFVERAVEETGLSVELLKRDLSRLLLAAEQAQAELALPRENLASKVALTPEERAGALAWLAAPDLIGRLRQAFTQAGLIGEENNALVAYLAGVSRKLERPLAVIIQSASAAGKTTLMDAVLSFFPEEERVKYSAMTGQSLYYLGETNLKHKILAVVEEAGAEKASYALKLLQSEGELIIASTGKDPQSGKMVTHEYRVEGPVAILLTTTAIDLDEELLNRCLTLSVDESAAQTGRIHQAQRERRTLAGLEAREQRREALRQLRNAQRLLQPLEVLNPYAQDLTFGAQRTRSRRDHEKYLTLIDSIALLHQRQRPRGRREICGRVVEYIEVKLEDIELANRLAPEALARSLDELPPQTRQLLGIVRELARRKDEAPHSGIRVFSRREICAASGWSLTQVRLHLERLVEHEYLAIRHGRLGSQFVYELLIDAKAPEKVAHIGLIEVAQLRRKYGYESNLAGFDGGVAGQNGRLAGGGQTPPPPSNSL